MGALETVQEPWTDKSLARSSALTLLIKVKAREQGFSSLKWQFTHHLFMGMLVTSEP